MIRFSFNIRIPGSNRFRNIGAWQGSLPVKYKFWELQVYSSADIVDVSVDITSRQSHSGIKLALGLLSLNVEFSIYDSRHWDSSTNTWEHYND